MTLSKRALRRSLLAAGLLLGGPAWALRPCETLPLPTVAPAAGVPELDSHLAQARHFAKRGWTADAIAELDRARQSPAGQESAELHGLLAELHLMEDALPAALCFAQEAVRLDPSRADLGQVVRRLEEDHGQLRIVAPVEGLATRLLLEAQDPLTSENEKALVQRTALRLREQTLLPATVSLPIGRYTVNGVAVEVVADRDAIAALPQEATGARGLASLQVTRVELAAGMLLIPGGALPELTPTTQVGLTVPTGLLLLGGVLDVQLPVGFSVLGRDLRDRTPASVTGGVRIGADLLTRLPLAIRPSVVLRGGQLAGIGQHCDASGRCGAPGAIGSDEDTAVHSMAWVLLPGGELSVDYRQVGRSGSAGFGLKAGAEGVFAWVPREGQAETGGAQYPWNSTDRRWTGVAVRVLANASFAF